MYSRIAKNARLGDGCVAKQSTSKNAQLSFISTDLDVLKVKRQMCIEEGFYCRDFRTQTSGYGGTKTIYNFHTRIHENITKIYHAEIKDLINTLDKEDLFLWYMDDGSWHKNSFTMHLYSNMLDDDETNDLIKQIGDIYGILPRARKDRKKDGRSFNYLYFPRQLVKLFRPEFKEYVMSHELESMYYKFGGLDYEEAV